MIDGLAGVVVAGGRSTRFGADKAAVPFLGRPMLAWVLDALSECCRDLVVVRAPGQDLRDTGNAPAFRLVHDEHLEQGPLAGLIAGFAALDAPLAFASATDVPLLRPAVIRLLADRAGGFDLVVPEVDGVLQPLAAIYRIETCLPAFRQSFAGGNRRVVAAFDGLSVQTVDAGELRQVDPDLLSFRSANTPAELATLARFAGE